MPNDDTISNTADDDQPDADDERQDRDAIRMAMPIITMPASRLITPTNICQPRPGRCGSLIAETVVATPRKMNPTPIQMASNRIA